MGERSGRRSPFLVRAALPIPLVLAWLALPVTARADDYHLDARSRLTAYEVRSPGSAVAWERRRFSQLLGLTWTRELADQGDGAGAPAGSGPRLSATVDLRVDQEMGRECLVDRERCLRSGSVSDPQDYQVLAEDGAIDVPDAFLDLSGLPLGARVRAGRHHRFDAVGPLRLDGGSLRLRPSPLFEMETYAGAQVRATTWLGSDAFAPSGSLRLSLPEGLDRDRLPFVDDPSTTWLVGATASAGLPRIVRVTAGFRETWDEDGRVARRLSVVAASAPTRALRLTALGVLDLLDGGAPMDLVGTASLDVAPVVITASVERHEPRFDEGTVWAYFDVVPVSEARLGATLEVGEAVTLGAGVRGRRADLPGEVELDGAVDAALSVRKGGYRFDADGFVWGGALAPLAAASVRLGRPLGAKAELAARVSAWHFDDRLRQGVWGLSVAEGLEGKLALTPVTDVGLDLEHVHSRVVGHRFRVLVWLALEVWR